MRYAHLRRGLFLSLAAITLLTGCEHGNPVDPDPDPDPTEATFSQIQQEIFNTSCAVSGCHTGSNPPLGLNLSAGQAYDNIVNVASVERPELFRIEPNDPANSYLLMKIKGAEGIEGQRMPLGRPALSAASINLVEEWIAAGAEEN